MIQTRGYIRRRGKNSFRLAVWTGKDDRGRDTYYYETFRGDEGGAGIRLAKIITDMNEQRFVAPAKVTLAEFLCRWLEDLVKVSVRPKTYEMYEMICRVHIIPELGHLRLDKLKPMAIQSFYSRKVTGPRADGKPGRLSPGTIRHIHNVLKIALSRAVKWQLLQANPLDKVVPPRLAKRAAAFWEAEQAIRFLEVARSHRLYPAFVLALTTGMRRGEVLGLRWTDVKFATKTIKISQALIAAKGGPVFQETKTAGSRRSVKVSDEVLGILAQLEQQQNEERNMLEEMYQPHGLVFCQEDGRPLDPRSFARSFERLSQRAGLPRIPFHALRHTHATLLIEAGVSMKAVSERLGHSDITTTLGIYSHTTPKKEDEAARVTSDLLLGNKQGTVVH